MRPSKLALIADLAPLAVYYGSEALWGTRTALILSIVWVFGEATAWRLLGRKLTPSFLLTAAVTLLFGAVDLHFSGPERGALEPAATYLLTAAFILSLLFLGRAIFAEMAEKQGRPLPAFTPGQVTYAKLLVWLWAGVFTGKAALAYWVAAQPARAPLLWVRILQGYPALISLAAASLLLPRALGRRRNPA